MVLEVFNPFLLIGIGIALIAFEAIATSFILVWFGVGFLLVGLFSFTYDFSDGLWQLGIVALISLILIALLRKKALEKFLKSEKEINDNFLDEKGIGEIKNSKVFYKGTYWEIEFNKEEFELKEEDKVQVLKTYKNTAIIDKK